MIRNKLVFEEFESDKLNEYLKFGNVFVVKYFEKHNLEPMLGSFHLYENRQYPEFNRMRFYPEAFGEDAPWGYDLKEIKEIALIDVGE